MGLTAKLDSLLEESGNIFELTHPWIFDSSLKPEIIDTPEIRERQRQNDESIKRVCEEIQKVCRPKPVKAVQDALFSDDKKGA